MEQKLAKTLAQNKMLNKKWQDFIAQFDEDSMRKGYYANATFELTAFCTLKCPMCYVRIDHDRARVLGGKPCSTEDWISLAKQYRDQGGIFLLLTGGEAMLRPDFPEIYSEISKLGLYISLFTNGTTVDDRMLELLRRRPPAMVGLTIYGASEETYRRFGGGVGSFQRAIDGLDRLLTIPNLAIDVRFTACRENYRDFKAVFDLVAKRDKILSMDFGACPPVRGASSEARGLRLSEDELKEVKAVLKEIFSSEEEKYSLTDSSCKIKEQELSDDIEASSYEDADLDMKERGLTCKSGKNSVYIAWDGRMYPCDMASYPYAFPLEQGFKAAAADIRRQVDALLYPERCMTCANRSMICDCIPKAQNEMRDCARKGERCNYIPKKSYDISQINEYVAAGIVN